MKDLLYKDTDNDLELREGQHKETSNKYKRVYLLLVLLIVPAVVLVIIACTGLLTHDILEVISRWVMIISIMILREIITK